MYLFRLNSLYRASPACPELPREMQGITLKTRENRIRAASLGFDAASAGNPEGASIFPAGIKTADGTGRPARGARPCLVRIAAHVYNRAKNLSSIARRADSRVTQAEATMPAALPR
jgi:hypothetical protein